MTNIPSHGGPSHHPSNTHNETSYRSYNNSGYHAAGQGVIQLNSQTTNYQYSPSNPLEELRKRCSPGAAFNAAARFHPPRCAESTRVGIIQIIEEWINGDGDNATPSSLFWLHGGAGAGKSAIAQTLSEKFQNKELAASFFFFRGDPTRNKGDHLIPTLVAQLISASPELGPFVEDRIRKSWDLFTKIYQIQIQELLIEPLLSLKSKSAPIIPPRLIVIDGLDECENTDVQCELLRAIARAIPHIPYPLRFLIMSRPEAHITHVFHHDPDLQMITVHPYNLSNDPDADMDIRKFLEKEFGDIRRVHRLGQHLPPSWPDQKAITSIVDRSSGHFIFASTVVRYIRSPKHRPDDRLEVILRLRPPQEGDRPFAQLDALYTLIFEGVESRAQLEKICLVLGILYVRSKKAGFLRYTHDCATEALLEMKGGDLFLILDPIYSLVTVDDDNIRILHKSLFDYLLDITRGGHLPFDLARVHESVATYILKQMIAKDMCDMGEFSFFAYHCQYAYLNDTLKGFLLSLDVPCPRSVLSDSATLPPWDTNVRRLIWCFLRTLGRKDFDSTGHVYEHYMTKWMVHLHSPAQKDTQTRNYMSIKMDTLKRWFKQKLHKTLSEWKPSPHSEEITEMNNLKCKLGALLKQWKPQHFNVIPEIEINPVTRLAYIKQEHTLLSTYSKVTFPDKNEIASSLIFGITTQASDMVGSDLLTLFSKQRGISERLKKKYLSYSFQKYGIEPDDGFEAY